MEELIIIDKIDDKKKVNKLFNLLTLFLALFFFVAQIYFALAMVGGIVAPDGLPINVGGIIIFINELKVGDIVVERLLILIVVALLYIVTAVCIIVCLIKSLIRVFKFFKINVEFDARKLAFDQYAKYAKTSFVITVILIAVTFALSYRTYLTGWGKGAVILTSIGYLCYASLVAVYNTLVVQEGGSRDWIEFAMEITRTVTLFIIAFVICAKFKPIIDVTPMFSEEEGLIYKYYKIKNYLPVIPYAFALLITASTINDCVFVQSKKNDTNRMFYILLLVSALILAIADCVSYKIIYKTGGSNLWIVNKYWLAYILASVGGIVLEYIVKSINKKQAK